MWLGRLILVLSRYYLQFFQNLIKPYKIDEQRKDLNMPKQPLHKPSALRRVKDAAHSLQWNIGNLKKGPSAGMRTDLKVGDRPVLFVHTPRTGGRSVEALLNVKRLSHRTPSEKLTEKQWLSSFVVSAVRHPLDRFFSHYLGLVKQQKVNRLVKLYGEGVHDLSPMEFLELTKDDPHYTGSQTQWTDFPSAIKPRADLVLRFEEIAIWPKILRDAGVLGGDKKLQHVGKSGSKRESKEALLGLSQPEMDEIRAAIEAHYADDYDTFNYERRAALL